MTDQGSNGRSLDQLLDALEAEGDRQQEVFTGIQQAMGDIVRQVPRLRHHIMAGAGLSIDGASAVILVRLRERGPQRVSDIAHQTDLDVSAVSRKVSSLEGRGLVVRAPDPVDGRAAIIDLTDDGRDAVSTLTDAWHDALEMLLEDWSEQELRALHLLARRYGDALRDLSRTGPPAGRRTAS